MPEKSRQYFTTPEKINRTSIKYPAHIQISNCLRSKKIVYLFIGGTGDWTQGSCMQQYAFYHWAIPSPPPRQVFNVGLTCSGCAMLRQELDAGHTFWSTKCKGLTFYLLGRPWPCLPMASSSEKTVGNCSHGRGAHGRNLGGPFLLDAHTRAWQLCNSPQCTLTSSRLVLGGAPSRASRVFTMLKAVAKLLVSILQLSKQLKCFHELDNQCSYQGESCWVLLRCHVYSFRTGSWKAEIDNQADWWYTHGQCSSEAHWSLFFKSHSPKLELSVSINCLWQEPESLTPHWWTAL